MALGFGMNLHEVLRAGRSGFAYTVLGIVFALVLVLTLGKVLRVHGNSSYLITVGTATGTLRSSATSEIIAINRPRAAS